MAKKQDKPKRTQKRWKKKVPLTSDDLRKVASRLGEMERHVKNWADDMDGAAISEIESIIQGIETLMLDLEHKMKVEFRGRIERAVQEKARRESEIFG